MLEQLVFENKPCLYRCVGYDRKRKQYILCGHTIIATTKKGVWIDCGYRKRFVRLDALRQWASLDKEKAIACYKHRLLRRIVILKSQLKKAEGERYDIYFYEKDETMRISPEPRSQWTEY